MTPVRLLGAGPLAFALCAFAAYRITRLLALDDILSPLREAWWRRFPEHTKPGELIACSYCVGMYVSALVLYAATAVGYFPWRWATIMLWPAVAGAQALLSALDDRLGG